MRGIPYVIVMMMLALVSCTKDIDFIDNQSESKLVINGLQKVGEPAHLCIERSLSIMDTTKDCRVEGVQVDLYVNGAFKESLQVRDSLKYDTVYYYGTWEPKVMMTYAFNYAEGSYLLSEGDQLRFEVRSSGLGTATAELVMPLAPQGVEFDTLRTEVNEYGGKTVYFSLRLQDPKGINFYNVRPLDGLNGCSSSDPVFAEVTDFNIDDLFDESELYLYGEYNLFPDTYFDGRQYDIILKTFFFDDDFYEPFTVEVSGVTESLYRYKKSYELYLDNDPEGILGMFTEPVQVYTNVQNGIGVVCGQSQPVSLTIDLTSDF